jgi:hypothetical protein
MVVEILASGGAGDEPNVSPILEVPIYATNESRQVLAAMVILSPPATQDL